MMPAPASSPKALPPAKNTACASVTRCPGEVTEGFLRPEAPPRTSRPQTAPFTQRTTVKPVAAFQSEACPTLMPGTSVREPAASTIRGMGGRWGKANSIDAGESQGTTSRYAPTSDERCRSGRIDSEGVSAYPVRGRGGAPTAGLPNRRAGDERQGPGGPVRLRAYRTGTGP